MRPGSRCGLAFGSSGQPESVDEVASVALDIEITPLPQLLEPWEFEQVHRFNSFDALLNCFSDDPPRLDIVLLEECTEPRERTPGCIGVAA